MSIVSDLIRDMNLWKPQREGLEAFDRIMTTSPVGRDITKRQRLGAMMVCEPPVSYAVQAVVGLLAVGSRWVAEVTSWGKASFTFLALEYRQRARPTLITALEGGELRVRARAESP